MEKNIESFLWQLFTYSFKPYNNITYNFSRPNYITNYMYIIILNSFARKSNQSSWVKQVLSKYRLEILNKMQNKSFFRTFSWIPFWAYQDIHILLNLYKFKYLQISRYFQFWENKWVNTSFVKGLKLGYFNT